MVGIIQQIFLKYKSFVWDIYIARELRIINNIIGVVGIYANKYNT